MILPLLCSACALLCACGGRSAPSGPASAGATIFRTDCSSCHTLTGSAPPRKQGGDLLGYDMTRAALAQYVAEMPTPHALRPAQLRAVTDYVLQAQRRHRRG